MSVKGKIERILKEFSRAADVDLCAVTSPEGFLMGAFTTKSSKEPVEIFAAISSTLSGGGIQVARRLKLGHLESMILTCENGRVLIMPLAKANFMAVFDNKAAMGIVLIEMEKAADALNELILFGGLRGKVDFKVARETIREFEKSPVYRRILEESRRD